MDKSKLLEVINECERFLFKAGDAHERLSTDKMANISGSKEVAACKRASMDLTRALAELRKPGR